MKIRITYLDKEYFYVQRKNLEFIKSIDPEKFDKFNLKKYFKKKQSQDAFISIEDKEAVTYLDAQHILNYLNIKDASEEDLNTIYDCLWKERTESFQEEDEIAQRRLISMMPYLEEVISFLEKGDEMISDLPPIPFDGARAAQDENGTYQLVETLNPFVLYMKKQEEALMPEEKELTSLAATFFKEGIQDENNQLTVDVETVKENREYLLHLDLCKRKKSAVSFFKKITRK